MKTKSRAQRIMACSLMGAILVAVPVLAQLSSKTGDWPQWRGLNRDGVSLEKNLL